MAPPLEWKMVSKLGNPVSILSSAGDHKNPKDPDLLRVESIEGAAPLTLTHSQAQGLYEAIANYIGHIDESFLEVEFGQVADAILAYRMLNEDEGKKAKRFGEYFSILRLIEASPESSGLSYNQKQLATLAAYDAGMMLMVRINLDVAQVTMNECLKAGKVNGIFDHLSEDVQEDEDATV